MASDVSQRLGLVVLTGIALGSSAVMNRWGLREIPPLWMVALRLALAAVLLLLTLLLLRRRLPRSPRTWMDITVVGVTFIGLPLTAFTTALLFISTAVLSVFIALIPLFTGVMAHFWVPGERLTRTRVAGLVLAMAGLAILLSTRTTGLAEEVNRLDVRGQLLALGGSLAAAASGIYARLRLRTVDAFVATGGETVVALLLVAPVAVAYGPFNAAALTWRGWLAAAYNGVVGSYIAFYLILYMIQRFGVTTAALSTLVQPMAAAIIGALLLGEILTLPLTVGAACILSGVFLAER